MELAGRRLALRGHACRGDPRRQVCQRHGVVQTTHTLVLLYFLILEGNRGPNQYGPDPKSSEPAFGAAVVPGYAAPPAPPAPPAPSVPAMPPMTPAPALPAAGWLPDPTQRHELRYWDGARWTENVSGGGVTGIDPL